MIAALRMGESTLGPGVLLFRTTSVSEFVLELEMVLDLVFMGELV